MANKCMKLFNANPWGKRIDDCMIRALVLGLGFDYQAACKELHVACKKGYGLVRRTGIDLDYIKKVLKPYFGEIVDFGEAAEVPPEFADLDKDDLKLGVDPTVSGTTLEDFIMMNEGYGSFLVGLTGKHGEGHIVFANCNKDKNFAVDTFDSSQMTVDAWMQIVKTLDRNDPRHYRLDPVTKKFITK